MDAERVGVGISVTISKSMCLCVCVHLDSTSEQRCMRAHVHKPGNRYVYVCVSHSSSILFNGLSDRPVISREPAGSEMPSIGRGPAAASPEL